MTVFSASNYYGPNSNLGAFIQISSKRVIGTPKAETRISIAEPVECEIDDLPTAQAPGMGSMDAASCSNISAPIIYTRIRKQPNKEENKQKQIVETNLVPRVVTFRAGRSKKPQTAFEKR